MRNVHQWRREIDKSIVRVFQFKGTAKTAESFLEPYGHELLKIRPGVYTTNSLGPVTILNGDFLVVYHKSKTLAVVKGGYDELYGYLFRNAYRYSYSEKRNDMLATDTKDPHGVLAGWDQWFKEVDDIGGGPLKFTPRKTPCGSDLSPEGWECTRDKDHDGPCAAVQKEPVTVEIKEGNGDKWKPKKKSFAQLMLGFLPIFHR